MDERSRRANGQNSSSNADRDKHSLRWAWVAGLAIPVVTFVSLVGAVLLTPGNPFSCQLSNPGAWMLCDWTREFVANLGTILLVLAVVSILLALLVGLPRAVLGAIRN